MAILLCLYQGNKLPGCLYTLIGHTLRVVCSVSFGDMSEQIIDTPQFL